ncbi:MAG: type II secretion system F family protein [Candidatus Omnitrophica bacterium]|nr:type II secretion system F family protein [Candidatus Omnitrophota bacterium]
MPRYFYIARNKIGHKQNGVEEASTQEEAISRIQARDLIVVSILPETKEAAAGIIDAEAISKSGFKLKSKHNRISGDDLVLFCRQIATLLGAGVTILKTLNIIAQQVSSRKLEKVIRDLQKDMEGGFSFHEAMAKHPTVFSELWINLIESGEASGNLAMVLNRLATYLEKVTTFRKKIISALIYPAILMVAGVGAFLFLTIKIMPTFAELFSGFNLKLPLLTQALIGFSVFIRKYAFVMFLVSFVLFSVFRSYIKTKRGRRKFEQFLFNVPMFNEFFRAVIVERFSSEMSTLIESGVPILYSLEITEHSVGNSIMSEAIRNIKDDVREGKPLRVPLERCGFFEPMVVQLITIGEEIGELSQMFKRINDFYQQYTETFLTRFTSMFEPMMLVCMGVVVGIMVIGMFLPIFQLASVRPP